MKQELHACLTFVVSALMSRFSNLLENPRSMYRYHEQANCQAKAALSI